MNNSNVDYYSKYYINDLSDHQSGNDFSNHNLQSNIYKNKYYINNQNDYSIDTYKSKYYKYKMKYLSLKETYLQTGGAIKKTDKNITIKKGLQYAEKLVGIKYSVSCKAPTKDSCPFWNRDGHAPSIEEVKKGGLACVGVTNLIRRHLGLKIPTEKGKWKDIFPGGSGAWFHYFKDKKRLYKIDYNKIYPKGTLLLQNWNPKDMGHVAIVWTENKKGLSHSKILHGRHDGPKSVVIEPLDDYTMKRRFTHICLPEDWLVKN
jgi:hypothetical protein